MVQECGNHEKIAWEKAMARLPAKAFRAIEKETPVSWSIVADLWDHSQVNSSELFVLLTIARHARACGHAWPSYGRLARLTRLNERTVKRIVKRLGATPYLLVHAKCGPKGSNAYTCVQGHTTTTQMGTCGNCNLQGVALCHPNLHLESDIPQEKIKSFLRNAGITEESAVYRYSLNGSYTKRHA